MGAPARMSESPTSGVQRRVLLSCIVDRITAQRKRSVVCCSQKKKKAPIEGDALLVGHRPQQDARALVLRSQLGHNLCRKRLNATIHTCVDVRSRSLWNGGGVGYLRCKQERSVLVLLLGQGHALVHGRNVSVPGLHRYSGTKMKPAIKRPMASAFVQMLKRNRAGWLMRTAQHPDRDHGRPRSGVSTLGAALPPALMLSCDLVAAGPSLRSAPARSLTR